jgi:hypothetical protein
MSEVRTGGLPALSYPFPSAINVHADAIGAGTIAWLTSFGLLSNEMHAAKIRAARFDRLAARAYPLANLQGLQLAADWTTWLFLRDDISDSDGFGSDPDAMREHSAALIHTLLQGAGAAKKRGPLILALADLRERILDLAGPLFLARFVGPVEDYLSACAWEANNRLHNTVPSVDTYKRMRLFTGGVLTCTALIEVTDHIALSLPARRDPTVQRMVEIASNVICWSNDIFSAEKEARKNDFHNLVIVEQKESGCSFDEAMARVVRMHDEEVAEFVRLARTLPTSEPALAHFVSVLEAWMRANYDWSLESGRYAASGGGVPSVEPPPLYRSNPPTS